MFGIEWLIYQLKEAGFKEVVEVKCNTGENKDLLIDKEGREAESLYVEAKNNKILLYGGKSTAYIVNSMLKNTKLEPSYIFDQYLKEPFFI